jgi:hypothetical protein
MVGEPAFEFWGMGIRLRSSFLPVILVAAAGAFALDLALPLGGAIALPYTALVLTALWAREPRSVVLPAIAAMTQISSAN